ncbi:MAG: hypothetical protein WCY58_08980 [Mariniphaga sp.]
MKQNYTQREFIRNNSLVGTGAIFCLGAVENFFYRLLFQCIESSNAGRSTCCSIS